MKFNKTAFMKALGILALSWLALPILYYIFCKRGEKNDRNLDKPGDNGNINVHSDQNGSSE